MLEEVVFCNVKKGEKQKIVGAEVRKKFTKFRDRVNKLDIFLCAPNVNGEKEGISTLSLLHKKPLLYHHEKYVCL